MALIQCPECGKENVSDSAEMCPLCGYGVKAHFERIKQEEQKQQIKKQQEEYEKKRLSNVKKPDKPNSFNGLMIFGVLCMIVSIFSLMIPDMAVFSLIGIAGGGWLYLEGDNQYKKQKETYELSLKDFEAYQKEQIKEEDERRRREEIRIANAIKCPMCGSANTERIGTVNRAVSVATVGLASPKIGKQYKCKNCKHMW